MLNRVRRLNISLAAKCQLLFGAAVVLIIGAALLVPWQRVEQLTDKLSEQVNDSAATTLVNGELLRHVAAATTRPSAVAVPPSLSPHPSPTAAARAGSRPDPPSARLVGMDARTATLTPWEQNVLVQLKRDPDLRTIGRQYTRRDGTRWFHYAQAVTPQSAVGSCGRCHTAPANAAPANAAATAGPPPVIGFVSVDIPSKANLGQLLLNRVLLLTAGLLAGTLAIAVFYLITTRLILQPVRVLQETAEKVSQGDLNIRSDINTGDEFQQLSEAFNTMLANLTANAEQLRQSNRALDVRVGQLAESNVALYESNRLKSEFLANVSHELRTPLNSILGFAELLKETAAGDARGSRYVGNILTSGRNLLDLINDLLDLAKIEAGRMEVRSEPLSLGDLFEGLTNLLKPVTEAKGLTLHAAVPADLPLLRTDPPKVQQVLYNFLSNAIKFSPAGGRIDLTADRVGDAHVRVTVADHGPGIDPADHAIIFEKFRQIDGSVTRHHSGTGLGLAISKELTGLLGGTIGVDSTPGQGARFWVVLPMTIAAGVHDVRTRVAVG